MDIKQKTINGLFWSFIDSFANQGVQFLVGIVLARILSPREFGLIGMLAIFIAISQTFIDSGFTNALIRKKDCSDVDYSTVFYFNICVGFFFYFLLVICARWISNFFKEPQLILLIRVLGLSLILNSFAIIQRTLLSKKIDFKLQTKVSVISAVGSGIVAITMAFSNYGVWSLVALTLTRFTLSAVLLWLWTKWKPIWTFSKSSFKELFSFGSKLLASGLIDTIYRNIYNMIIGKYFLAEQLGFYTTADQFQAFPSQNLQGIIGRVSYPVLVTIKDDSAKLKTGYVKLIKSTMLISFILMIGLAVVAKPLILVLIGEKWLPAADYLELLCFVGMFYPLHALNLNMLQVEGRSDLFLRLEVIKKILAVPVIIIGVFFGIKAMIIGMIVNNIIAYYLNSYWSGKMIGYSFFAQIRDILPAFLIALIVNGLVFLTGLCLNVIPLLLLIIQITMGCFITILLCELFKFQDYLYIKKEIIDFINKLK